MFVLVFLKIFQMIAIYIVYNILVSNTKAGMRTDSSLKPVLPTLVNSSSNNGNTKIVPTHVNCHTFKGEYVMTIKHKEIRRIEHLTQQVF